jgi:outer membrane protein assembly factor BamE (lipoprotein component of BamABCDE complex)
MSSAIEMQSKKLLALSEQEIVTLLGKPDENELYKRNQKFYYYFLEPSKQCSDTLGENDPQKLVIRFNAIGLAKEVSIE